MYLSKSIVFLIPLLMIVPYGESSERSKRSFLDSITDTVADAYRNVKETVQHMYTAPAKIDSVSQVITQLQNEIKTKNTVYQKKIRMCLDNVKRMRVTGMRHNVVKFGMKYYDAQPMTEMNTAEIIAACGYHAESHTILTDDGYILTVHRIPFSKKGRRKSPKKTVLLHHGLFGSSADWVLTGPEKGLAFILSDAGYDVWLANVRGNTYSRSHVRLPIESTAFWNFSWHDISQHDLPAVIDYIMIQKGFSEKINYIGHSMGTTVLFALLATKPAYNNILRAGFALAPIAYMRDVSSPLHYLSKYVDDLQYIMNILGANELLPQSHFVRWVMKHTCEMFHYEEIICENMLFLFCGYDRDQFNSTLLPVILSHVPAGTSTKTLLHYAQEIKNQGRFQQYDYGPNGNRLAYGNVTPPEYPVNQITLPIALFSAQNDRLATESSVQLLYQNLVNPMESYVVKNEKFNHIDFLWGIDAPDLVYKKLLKMIVSLGNVSNHV